METAHENLQLVRNSGETLSFLCLHSFIHSSYAEPSPSTLGDIIEQNKQSSPTGAYVLVRDTDKKQ
jgi:hypothetical protein